MGGLWYNVRHMEEEYTTKWLAQVLGVSTGTILKIAKAGGLDVVPGCCKRYRRYTCESVRRLLEHGWPLGCGERGKML